MYKTLLIARREYLAFVRTVGFWLSILTVPLLIGAAAFLPLMLNRTATPQSVAVLDLSGEHLDSRLRDLIRSRASGSYHDAGLRLAALPAGLSPDIPLAAAEAKLPALLRSSNDPPTVLIAYKDDGGLHFHIWSESSRKGDLAGRLQSDLNALEFERLARANGLDPQLMARLQAVKADIVSLTPNSARKGGGLEARVRDNAPRAIGAVAGYLSWMAIFSSSMILLGSVIEEKASKVLEVLLASVSTTSLLVGKVLGVAMVLLTVTAIWVATVLALGSYGLSLAGPQVVQAVGMAVNALFSPIHVLLLLAYFLTGYLMFGVFFAAIGAFCETQKDAQAVMGPIMVVLMIPMLCMQTAFVSGDVPLIRYLSWVPFFTPFLMPLRLGQPLPWYEIAGTLGGMGIVAVFMMRMGGKAFRHGALTGVRLSWGALLGFGRKEV